MLYKANTYLIHLTKSSYKKSFLAIIHYGESKLRELYDS